MYQQSFHKQISGLFKHYPYTLKLVEYFSLELIFAIFLLFLRKEYSDNVVQLPSHVQLFWDRMDCSPPGSEVHGISQTRMEWVIISFSRASSQPMIEPNISCVAGRFFTTGPPGKSQYSDKQAQNSAFNLNENSSNVMRLFTVFC